MIRLESMSGDRESDQNILGGSATFSSCNARTLRWRGDEMVFIVDNAYTEERTHEVVAAQIEANA